MDPSDVVFSRNDHVGPTQEMSNTHFSDGDFSDGDFSDGEFSDGDFSDGDFSDGDISDGDISDGDFSDGDFSLRSQAFVSLGELIPLPQFGIDRID